MTVVRCSDSLTGKFPGDFGFRIDDNGSDELPRMARNPANAKGYCCSLEYGFGSHVT